MVEASSISKLFDFMYHFWRVIIFRIFVVSILLEFLWLINYDNFREIIGQLDRTSNYFWPSQYSYVFSKVNDSKSIFTMIVYFTFAILHIIVCILLGTDQTIENGFLGNLGKNNGALSSIRHFFIIGELQTYEKSLSIMPKICYLAIR